MLEKRQVRWGKVSMATLITLPLWLGLNSPLYRCQPAYAQAPTPNPTQNGSSGAGNNQARSPKKFVSPPFVPNLHFSKEIPINFPVPIYSSNVLNKAFMNTTKGTPQASVSIQSKDSASTAYQWYVDYFKKNSWTLKQPNAKAQAQLSAKNEVYMLEATQGKNFVMLVCSARKDKTQSNILVNWEMRKVKP